VSRVPELDWALIERILAEARLSPRLRKNFNFHGSAAHPCQRLVNAVLPGAYIQPHRHLDPNKEEMLVILRGRLGLVFFDEVGNVVGKTVIEEGGERLAVNIPVGMFHTALALDAEAVVFEAKAGPFVPHTAEETARFAPAENLPQAAAYLERLKRLFTDA
jgi:cupin fold WbuC family metalloprotein